MAINGAISNGHKQDEYQGSVKDADLLSLLEGQPSSSTINFDVVAEGQEEMGMIVVRVEWTICR